MNAVVLLVVGVAILVAGYIFYGGWLAKQWGLGENKEETPAHTMEDGQDYVPAKAPVLMGHHFSSIAGAGPINGPIQAAVFGWIPVMLWVLIGGIFFGATHDFGALFASLRNKGQSIGEIIETSIGKRAKRLFLTFAYLTLILVVAAFASIVANTFKATYTADGAVDVHLLWSAHDRRDLPHGELYSGLRSLCGGRGRHEPEQLCLCGGGDPFGHSGGGQGADGSGPQSGLPSQASHDAGHSAPGGAEHSSCAGQ